MNPMKRDDGELAKLRRGFAALSEETPASAACLAPEKIWEAVRGGLPSAEIREIVAHTAACPACAEDWRLAMAMQRPETAKILPAADRFSVGRRLRNWSLAAAAVLALAVVGVQWLRLSGPEAIYREGGQAAVHSLIADGQSLPREQFLLRWEAPALAGATWDVEVSTEDLRVLASGDDLREPQLQVPAGALAGLPAGTRILWKVEATLAEGGRVGSPTFVATVQ
ncbi:MAG TPA: hypothetical protein DD490_07675 [Acidobacteria bacterium]|nr:hypothetical protein [Acidobacteriota bacterium]